jgi:hypothetical protein
MPPEPYGEQDAPAPEAPPGPAEPQQDRRELP